MKVVVVVWVDAGVGGVKMRGKNEGEDMGHYVIRRADTLGSMDHFTVISLPPRPHPSPHLPKPAHHSNNPHPPMAGVAALIWVSPANRIGLAARRDEGESKREKEERKKGW